MHVLLLCELTLLISCSLVLSACAAPLSMASAPPSTPTPRSRQHAAEPVRADRVELAAGHYQLIMFYSPL